MKSKIGLFIKNKKQLKPIERCWEEIRRQALPGTGIHLRVEVHPTGEIVISGDVERFKKRFAGAEIILDETTIGASVKRITDRGLNILKATKKDLVRCRILKS